MGIELIHTGTYRARKEYHDDGAEEIIEWAKREISPEDLIVLELLLEDKPYRIQKGQLYQRQFNKMDGDAGVWRTKQIFFDLMCKYNLFPEY